jgi:hypothetical protein
MHGLLLRNPRIMLICVIFWRFMRKFSIFRLIIESTLLSWFNTCAIGFDFPMQHFSCYWILTITIFFPQFNTLQSKCKGVNMLTRVIFWRSMRKFSIFRLVIESTLLAGLIFDWTDWSQIRLSRVSNPHRVGRASIHGLPNVFLGMKSNLEKKKAGILAYQNDFCRL